MRKKACTILILSILIFSATASRQDRPDSRAENIPIPSGPTYDVCIVGEDGDMEEVQAPNTGRNQDSADAANESREGSADAANSSQGSADAANDSNGCGIDWREVKQSQMQVDADIIFATVLSPGMQPGIVRPAARPQDQEDAETGIGQIRRGRPGVDNQLLRSVPRVDPLPGWRRQDMPQPRTEPQPRPPQQSTPPTRIPRRPQLLRRVSGGAACRVSRAAERNPEKESN